MMNIKAGKAIKCIFLFLLAIAFTSCSYYQLKNHSFPIPEDSHSVAINEQVKTSYRYDGVYADNTFNCARMNGFKMINDTTFRVIVSPENFPINASSYFSFRLRSEKVRTIDLEIEYTHHTHRYVPKLSYDGVRWRAMEASEFDTLKAGNLATLRISLDERWLYVSAQELMCSDDALSWTDSLARTDAAISHSSIGLSMKGRDIICMDINRGKKVRKKQSIVVFSRLHPPELSGYIAMKAFVETLLDDTQLAQQFREKYRIIVYPMINPDGVDMGHWRHNVGGVDLNRDWSHYRQKEVGLVANDLMKRLKTGRNKVVLGIDFHSTQRDLYYTLTDNRISVIDGFKDYWFEGIDNALDSYTPDEQAYDLNQPITKGWFYLQFGAESITYEVGDETPRDFVNQKARVAAQEMMKLLVFKN